MDHIYDGRVKSIMDYGAFIELVGVYPYREGLCHISNITQERIRHPSDVLHRDQRVKVKVIQVAGNKVSLSMKAVDQQTGEEYDAPRASSYADPPSRAPLPPVKRKRLSSYERFEMEQLIASGVMSAEEQKRLLAQYDMGGVDQDFAPEEAVNIEVEQNIAPFLSDHKLVKLDLEPTKIVKNPEGTMARNALAGQAMMQERKLLRERHMREEREKLPEVCVRAWRDV